MIRLHIRGNRVFIRSKAPGKLLRTSAGMLVILLSISALSSCKFFKWDYGPASLQVVTDDNKKIENIVVMYGANVAIMEGSRNVFTTRQIAKSNSPIVFPVHEFGFSDVPSAFWVLVCHPMYICAEKYIRDYKVMQKSKGKIDFGEIRLTNLLSAVKDVEDKDERYKRGLNTVFERHMINMQRDYMPYVSDKIARSRKVQYAEYMVEVCKNVRKIRDVDIVGLYGVCNDTYISEYKNIFY